MARLYVDIDHTLLLRSRRPARRREANDGQHHARRPSPQLRRRARHATTDWALKQLDHRLGRRRRLCAARAVGLRQDHASQPHLRPAQADRGAHPLRRPRRHRRVARGAQHRPGVPVPGHLRHDDRLRQSRLPAAQPRRRRRARSTSGCARSPRCSSSTPCSSNARPGLTADGKQKISLGRGLVRSDVNVIMFDEPLTVIDPHLKWVLRSKLKELHQRIRRTMIYVTHDQTEALTFADQVVVMNDGEIVQIGTPIELFERPQPHLRRPFHRLAGHERAALRGAGRQGDLRRPAGRDGQRRRRIAATAGASSSASGRSSSASPTTASRSRSSRCSMPGATASSRPVTPASTHQAAGARGQADSGGQLPMSASIRRIGPGSTEDGWMVT